jgi:ATP-binding cassette, subfamily C, bacterial
MTGLRDLPWLAFAGDTDAVAPGRRGEKPGSQGFSLEPIRTSGSAPRLPRCATLPDSPARTFEGDLEKALEEALEEALADAINGLLAAEPAGPAPTIEAAAPAALRAPVPEERAPEQHAEKPSPPPRAEVKSTPTAPGMVVIEGDRGPIKAAPRPLDGGGSSNGGGGSGGVFHKRLGPVDFAASLKAGQQAIKKNLMVVMVFTIATNVLVLAIPVYLFQISDRVLTSRSIDTLVMLTALIVGAVILQAVFDAFRRLILMRTAVEIAAQLGAPILSAAARASLNSNGREYQTLGDLQQLRTFLVSGTLLAFLDAPIVPFFVLAVFLIHVHLGSIVVGSALLLLVITLLNQKATAAPFGEANSFQTKANLHLDSMSRNSQIINALAMIPEAVRIWGKDTAGSLTAQVLAQDRNIAFAAISKAVRLLTQVTMLGWGANLALHGELTGGMVIAASIIAGRALGPIEGAIEGWNQVIQSRASYSRITALLQNSPLNFERLKLPRPEGRLDVERLLFVPQGTKRVVLNGVTFSLGSLNIASVILTRTLPNFLAGKCQVDGDRFAMADKGAERSQ